MDGEVIIGTKLDTKELERDLKNEQKKLEQFEKETEKLTEQKVKIEAEVEIKGQEFNRKIKEIEQKAKIDVQAVSGGTPYSRMIKEQKIQETAQLKINSLQEQWNQYLDKSDAKLEEIGEQIQKNTRNQQLSNNKISEFSSKLTQVKGFNNIKNSIDKVGNSVENVTKKVGRWALAVFGVRSAYMFVRQAMSTLSQYDDQMAVNIEYIRYLLASTLKPVIETIINLAYRLLTYINAIAQAWFGVNLFANASTKAFEKQNKALGGSVKQAKELNKQLAGFDEMNILQDNGNVGSGGGGGGATMPTLPDFPKMEDIKIPSWLQWILDHKDEVIAGILGIAGAVTALKLGFSGLQSLGIGIAITGIVLAIQALIDYLKDPSLENFGKIITGIGIAVAGIAIAFGALPVAIGAAIAAIIGIVVSNWDKIKKTIQGAIDWVRKNFANLGGEVLKPLLSILPNAMQLMLDFVDKAIASAKNIFDGLIKFIKGVFTGDWKLAWEGIKQILKGVFDGFVNIMTTPIKAAWTIIKGVLQTISNMIDGIFNKLRDGAQKAMNGIKSVFSGFASWLGGIFSNAWNRVKAVFSTGGKVFTGIKEGIEKAFKNIVNKLIDGINKVISIPFNKLNSSLKNIRNVNILGQKPFKGLISTISVPKIPHLAKGGIINQPGRGVPIGQAIGGENKMEGVIPLTDSQQMSLLGEAIGRYITVELTNVTQLDGRQIARKVEQINQNNKFVLNR